MTSELTPNKAFQRTALALRARAAAERRRWAQFKGRDFVKVIHVAAIVGATFSMLSACSGNGSNNSTPCNTFSSSFTIKDRMGQAVSTFTAGETITFESRVTNTSDTSKTLTISAGCNQINFEAVNSSNQSVWASDCGPTSLCSCATNMFSYAPGETKIITADWNQQQQNGTQTPLGQYTANALDATQCSPELNKSAVFGIQ
jgi:hypothetical protein